MMRSASGSVSGSPFGGCWLLCLVCLCVALCFSCSSSGVLAQGFNKAGLDNASLIPVCFVQVSFNKVSKVDGVEQLFDADFYMQLFWLDLNLQTWYNSSNNTSPNQVDGIGQLPPVASGNFEFTPRLNYWYDPLLEFVNGDGDIVSTGTYYTINTPPFVTQQMLDDLGVKDPRNSLIWTVKDFRYIGSFTTPLDLHSFPYDRQYVQLVIESQWADATQLTLVYSNSTAAELKKVPPDTNTSQVIGWQVEDVKVIRTWHNYNLYPGGNYSRLVVAMSMTRQPEYYVGKIVVGVVLLVLMCVCVYSLAVDEADRQMGTLQVFAGIVTFLFVASADVPKIPYLTRLDMFFLLSFGFTAFMLVSHSVSYFWRSDEGQEEEESVAGSHLGKDWHAEKSTNNNSSSKMQIAYGPTTTSQSQLGASPDAASSSLRQRKSTPPGSTTSISPTSPAASEGQTTDLEMQPLSSSPTTTDLEQKQAHDSATSGSIIINNNTNVKDGYDLRKPSTRSAYGADSASGSVIDRWWSSIRSTWRRSSCLRKTDTMFVCALFIAYAIACAVILGSVTSSAHLNAYDKQVLNPWPILKDEYEWLVIQRDYLNKLATTANREPSY